MKKLALSILAVLMLIPASVSAKTAEVSDKLPPRADILKTLITVNDYYLKNHPDPLLGIPYWGRKRVYEANLWTRAVYFEGLMALYSIYPDNRYYDYVYKWGDGFNWDMRRGETYTRNADNYACGQAYVDMYRLAGEPKMLTKSKACMNMLVNTPQVDDWTWIDAIQMGMPLLAKLSSVTGDPRYNEKAWKMYEYTRNQLAGGLYNQKDGLWWRDKGFVPPYKEPNGKNLYWSRGNGWVVAALVRVLDEIPADDPHRAVYVKDLQDMCAAAVKCMREDGFWNVSMHDPSNFGGKEITGTALFVYGMAWGVRNGILDRAKYMPIIAKSWNAMVNDAVHPNGYLGYVQGTGKEPKDGQPVAYDSKPDFDDYGTGCFLLAGTEVYKLD